MPEWHPHAFTCDVVTLSFKDLLKLLLWHELRAGALIIRRR